MTEDIRDEEFGVDDFDFEEEVENVERSGRSMRAQFTDADHLSIKRVDPDEADTYIYTPPQAAEIPPEVEARFENLGYKLRWLRFQHSDGMFDTQHVRQKYKEGYKFLTPEDVPELSTEFGVGRDVYGSMIINGNNALACIPIYKSLAKKKYFVDMARQKEGQPIRKVIQNDSKYAKVLDASTKRINTVEGFAASSRYNND